MMPLVQSRVSMKKKKKKKKLANCSYHMEVLEEEGKDGRSKLNYTHVIQPGVTQLENYGRFPLTIIYFSVSRLVSFFFLSFFNMDIFLLCYMNTI
jgi:hypothetical protein